MHYSIAQKDKLNNTIYLTSDTNVFYSYIENMSQLYCFSIIIIIYKIMV